MNTPAEIAKNYVAIGKAKVNLPLPKMFVLAILAGAFIALAGLGSVAVAVTVDSASIGKFLGAMIFPGGLTMVILAGSELFTGNSLLAIPLLEKEITVWQMLRNWIVVWVGNLVGGILVSAIVIASHEASLFSCGLATSLMSTAAAKCTISFSSGVLKGIACNFLVCIAVWVAFAAKQAAGKVIALFFPILIFVLCGFEHCVANMFYISAGLFAKMDPVYIQAAAEKSIDVSGLTWQGMFAGNLLPVTIGNIIGGFVCVGCAYWFVYLKKSKK